MMRLKKRYIIFLFSSLLCFQSCDSNENEEVLSNNKIEEINIEDKYNDTVCNINDTTDTHIKTDFKNSDLENIDSLHSLWTWNEKPPAVVESSKVINFKYDEKKLFKKWGRLKTNTEKVEYLFSIDENGYNWNGYSYLYKVKHDSIWIYTNSDILDGIDRGIISNLTNDSLIISWSTGDCDLYFAVH